MGDKDLVTNGIQPRYDDIRISNNDNTDINGLFNDKELFNNPKDHTNSGRNNVYQDDEEELPTMKVNERKKKREDRKKKVNELSGDNDS